MSSDHNGNVYGTDVTMDTQVSCFSTTQDRRRPKTIFG